jgi:hypothetical protein
MAWVIKAQAFTLQPNLQRVFAVAKVRARIGRISAAAGRVAGCGLIRYGSFRSPLAVQA